MFKALLVVCASLAVSVTAANGGIIPDNPIVWCQTCQAFAYGVTQAVKVGKTSAYAALTGDFCNSIFPDAQDPSQAFCKALVTSGSDSLAVLLAQNSFTNSPLSSCIAIGACPKVACPVGLTQVGNTQVCAYCNPTLTDSFGAPYTLRNSNATRYCSITDYLVVAPGYQGTGLTSGSSYLTGQHCHCNSPTTCQSGHRHDEFAYPDYQAADDHNDPFYHSRIANNWIVNVNSVGTGGSTISTIGVSSNPQLYVCVCADLYRPSVYGWY